MSINDNIVRRVSVTERGLSVSLLNKLIDKANRNEIHFDPAHFQTHHGSDGIYCSLVNPGGGGEGGSAEYDFAGDILSISNSALTVKIKATDVVIGANHTAGVDTVVSIGGTISAKHYIYAFGSLAPLSIAIAANTTGTFPVHAANQWRRALYEVYVSAGAVVINRILHRGIIDLTGFYS